MQKGYGLRVKNAKGLRVIFLYEPEYISVPFKKRSKKLTIETLEHGVIRHCHRFGVFIVNFEHISHLF